VIFLSKIVYIISLSGGSLTKIAYYSTISHRRVLYEAEKEDGRTSQSADEVC
jgi:hypothetical protein